MQDFMGFLHLGWEVATRDESPQELAAAAEAVDASPAWQEVAKVVDLQTPGLATVRRVMKWEPLHMAAMHGDAGLVRRLVQEFGCDAQQRSANSWTPLHCAAAHNQVGQHLRQSGMWLRELLCVLEPYPTSVMRVMAVQMPAFGSRDRSDCGAWL